VKVSSSSTTEFPIVSGRMFSGMHKILAASVNSSVPVNAI